MKLIKEINDLHKKTLKEQQELAIIEQKIHVVFKESNKLHLLETAEDFLQQVIEIIKAGKNVDSNKAEIIGAKLTGLELIADKGNRAVALELAGGSNLAMKIAAAKNILKQTTATDQSSNPIDKLLVNIAKRVGRSGVKANTEFLVNLEKIPPKQRSEKIDELTKHIHMFKQLEDKLRAVDTKGEEVRHSPVLVGA